MGRSNHYKCESCDYAATVSGKPDRGRFIKTNTFSCNDCNELVDLAIYQFETKEEIKPKCRNCNSTDLKVWSLENPNCPTCGGKMIESEGGLIINWD